MSAFFEGFADELCKLADSSVFEYSDKTKNKKKVIGEILNESSANKVKDDVLKKTDEINARRLRNERNSYGAIGGIAKEIPGVIKDYGQSKSLKQTSFMKNK